MVKLFIVFVWKNCPIMFDDEFGFFNRPYVNSLSVNIVDYKPFADEFPDWVPSGD